MNIVKRHLHVSTQGDVTQEAVFALLGPCVACARQKPSKGEYLLNMRKVAMMRHGLGEPRPRPPPASSGGDRRWRGRRCPAPGPRPPAAGPGQESGGTQGSQGRADPDTQGAGRVEAGGRPRPLRQLDPEHGAAVCGGRGQLSNIQRILSRHNPNFLSAYLLDPFS